ncbi:putative toxin-antitoxin system toxin component, PIN family [Parageobacillus toebii]|uniref:putative toxin-antitoxin system toxin component, PIN family n=1 Tax=Parageobacillus toebii TaxID=153151 RepID=UPI001967E42E|nr:putative toxin-antitoxin system toxin component, PIN family [Parageobacillus toebii]QSB48779.1 putative toxin-antitoxin system toxin component, PIN family [Parageobacillus toebii]
MKLVVDSSTIIRGLFRKFTEPAYIVDRIADNSYQLLMTEEMAKELLIAIYIACRAAKLDESSTKKYLRAIATFTLAAQKVKIRTKFTSCSDPDDNMFIECAINGKAKYCISSDPSIYTIKSYCKNQHELNLIKDIDFFNPEKFYEHITKVKK